MPRLTPKSRDRILAALREGYRRPDAAARVGVDVHVIGRWLYRGYKEKVGAYAEFRQAFYAAVREGRLVAISAVIRAVHEGDWATALAWLDRTFPPVCSEDSTILHICQALHEAQAAAETGAAPSPAEIWQRTWQRLCRDLGARPVSRLLSPLPPHGDLGPLDDYSRAALRRLLSAALTLRGGPCVGA